MYVSFTSDQGAKSPKLAAKTVLARGVEAFGPGIGAIVCEKCQHIMSHPRFSAIFVNLHLKNLTHGLSYVIMVIVIVWRRRKCYG